jgi:hypothetical protein
MTGSGTDKRSRLTQWLGEVRSDLEREAPNVLEAIAKDARGLAKFLDDKAKQARVKQAAKGTAPEPAEVPEAESREADKPTPR